MVARSRIRQEIVHFIEVFDVRDPYHHQTVLSQKEVMEMLSLSRSSWYEFIADPDSGFPTALVIGKSKTGKPIRRWSKIEIMAWLATRPRAKT